MRPPAAKKLAAAAGLELFYDLQWRSWGLIDPECRCESLWLSPGQLGALHPDEFNQHYVAVMQDRVKEAAQ